MIPIIYADIIDDAVDLALFEEIYEEYYRQMFFKANKILNDTHESEDAVHDAFIGIARNMKTVRAIQEKADLYYYMVRAAENAAYNRTRQTRHYANAVPLDEVSIPSKRPFWHTVCTMMDYEQLVRIITAMPRPYREVLYYHFVMELTIQEVADGLDIKLCTAKQRLVRGKKMLIAEVKKEGGFNYGAE